MIDSGSLFCDFLRGGQAKLSSLVFQKIKQLIRKNYNFLQFYLLLGEQAYIMSNGTLNEYTQIATVSHQTIGAQFFLRKVFISQKWLQFSAISSSPRGASEDASNCHQFAADIDHPSLFFAIIVIFPWWTSKVIKTIDPTKLQFSTIL